MVEDGKLRRELHREQVAFRRRFFNQGDEENGELAKGLVPRSPPPYKPR